MYRITLLTIFTLILLTGTAISQAVVIEPDNIPMEAGTVFNYQIATDADGIEVDVGQAGEDRRWDFTALDIDFLDFSQDSLIEPENAPDIETYEGANRVLLTESPVINIGGQTLYQYENVSEDGWVMIGAVPIVEEGGVIPDIPFDFTENPITIMPMPGEYGDEWDITIELNMPLAVQEEWGEEFALLDSIIISFAVGGFVETDAWGTVVYSGGEVEALRQHARLAGDITVIGVRYIFGQRVAIEIPLGLEIEAAHSYRWVAPDVGEIALITSLPLEEDPNFGLASEVRFRYLPPGIMVEEPEMDFGMVSVGNAGVSSIDIQNVGSGAAVIARVEYSEILGEQIETLDDLPFSIAPDSVESMRFLWMPPSEQRIDEEIVSLYHNDPNIDNPIRIVVRGSTPAGVGETVNAPNGFKLYQNAPNPFNSQTEIRFNLLQSGHVTLDLIDIRGRSVAVLMNEKVAVGEHSYQLNGGNLSAGVYLYRLTAGDQVQTKKMVYVR